MLDPNSRRLYLEALQSPEGYRLDRAVATTFSLDLLTLLMAPLSFAMFECEHSEIRCSKTLLPCWKHCDG